MTFVIFLLIFPISGAFYLLILMTSFFASFYYSFMTFLGIKVEKEATWKEFLEFLMIPITVPFLATFKFIKGEKFEF